MSSADFIPYPKIPRLNRDVIFTEKLDGTNACVAIHAGKVFAQSRSRIITPEVDNHGFAAWVAKHEAFLIETLGEGHHFGEWWGPGINRGYGVATKRLSLFNTYRWSDLPANDIGLGCVPILHVGRFEDAAKVLEQLKATGSIASPGFMRPEGIIAFHTASNHLFKVLVDNDEGRKNER